jgi:hypothetical protein
MNYQAKINKATTGRKFCVSGKRYTGWVPSTTVVEDFICVLFGVKVLYVLRAIENEPDHYYLISECYLHGIMQGEATICGSPVLQDFRLR